MSRKMKIILLLYTTICLMCVAVMAWQHLLLLESRDLLAAQLRNTIAIEWGLNNNKTLSVTGIQNAQDILVEYFYNRNLHSFPIAIEIRNYCRSAEDRISQDDMDKLINFSERVRNQCAIRAEPNCYTIFNGLFVQHMFKLFYPKEEQETDDAQHDSIFREKKYRKPGLRLK